MASSSSSSPVALRGAASLAVLLAAVCLVHAGGAAAADLCVDYYDCTCPDAYKIVQGVLVQAHKSDPRIFASLIRLHFHDCFVQGCDGSLLLNTFNGMETEQDAIPNKGSARGYDVVDAAKAALEAACPGVVSCADILAIAAEISVQLSGGPGWSVLLGRLDGFTSNFFEAGKLPSPFDGLKNLKEKFRNATLDDTTDLVALSGAHTFGRVQCQFVTDRLYNFSGTNRPDPTLNPGYRAFLSQRCPQNGDGRSLNDLDPTTPDKFDKNYFTSLEVNRGFLQSDQELKSDPLAVGTTAPIVDRFAGSQDAFFKAFANSMIKMGNIRVITDPSKGEVRKRCAFVN
ncbi:peroxidase A2-like [Triticum dicoccoides]|uniref:peroxidase A2-like n=1 Tax=Triticum dicoccoides TaxID=85692 RepID=UPI00188EA4A7|nr:peroxidase A2-like [Triticum dicoccoides]